MQNKVQNVRDALVITNAVRDDRKSFDMDAYVDFRKVTGEVQIHVPHLNNVIVHLDLPAMRAILSFAEQQMVGL